MRALTYNDAPVPLIKISFEESNFAFEYVSFMIQQSKVDQPSFFFANHRKFLHSPFVGSS
jgi:hypothetical protein